MKVNTKWLAVLVIIVLSGRGFVAPAGARQLCRGPAAW